MKDVKTVGRVGLHLERTNGRCTNEQLDIVKRHGKWMCMPVWSHEGDGMDDGMYGLRCIHE